MKYFILGLALVVMLVSPALAQTAAPPYSALKIGDLAPDFTLVDTAGKQVKLSEFRGKSNVVLAFYVFAFTGG